MTKILHISTHDTGGAGLAALRLHLALLDQGIDSKMLVAEKKSNINSVIIANESTINKYIPPKNSIIRFFKVCLRKIGIGITKFEIIKGKVSQLQKKYPVIYSYPISSYELHKHPLVQDADLIHLHWIENFVDFETFFTNINKPIVWTFHDLNPMFGGFHHFRKRQNYYKYYKDIEDYLYDIKVKSIAKAVNLNIVAISDQMKHLIETSELYKKYNTSLIHNSVDGSKFKLFEKEIIRKTLCLPEDKKILLFVNTYLNDSEKGLETAISAINSLHLTDILLVCVGEGVIPECECTTIQFHSVQDSIWLSMLYSAADLLIFPSFQEAFAQTPLEALCCGTPVVITPVSGAKDIINYNNGVISKDYSPENFAKSIMTALSKNYDSNMLRSYVLNNYNPQRIAQLYSDLYYSVLKNNK